MSVRIPTARGVKERVRRFQMAYDVAQPRKYIFVMSHMRSYSSLLCHILNSHPDINGYVELHKAYRSELDLLDLTLRVRASTKGRLKGRFVLDKILHNYVMLDEVLKRKDLHMVYSVREPEQTIRSIIAMGLRREDIGLHLDWKSEPDKVVRHYIKRLERITEIAPKTPKRSVFFEADRLITDPEKVLGRITKTLKLETPLQPTYETAPLTGRRGFGDPSPYITKGAIVADRDDYSHIDVPDKLMNKAHRAFEECRSTLLDTCQYTVGGGGKKRRAAETADVS